MNFRKLRIILIGIIFCTFLFSALNKPTLAVACTTDTDCPAQPPPGSTIPVEQGCFNGTCTQKCSLSDPISVSRCGQGMGCGQNGYCINEDVAQQEYADSQGWLDQTYEKAAQEVTDAKQTGNITALPYTYYQAQAFFLSGAMGIMGDNPKGNTANNGALSHVTNMITALSTNPPASSVTYLADIGRNIGIAKPTYAQGIGFAGLNPILKIWKAFRNLAYLAFILIFVVYGFMIMFRVKIDPRTVVSFQTALPKIVISLILVTFSYAIVGLLIDLSYLLIFAAISFFQTANLIDSMGGTQIQNVVFNQNIFRVVFNNFPNFVGAPAGAIGEMVGHLVGDTPGVKTFVGGATGALATLIFAIAILFVMLKLFFSLLGAYVGIITDTIFAPIKLLFDVLPGQNGFAGWISGLLANILVFPATVFMLMLAAVLMGNGGGNPWGVQTEGYGELNAGWVPPLLGMQEGNGAAYVPSLIGLGILFLTPKIVDMIKEMFQVKPSKFSAGDAIKSPINIGMQAASSAVTLRQLRHKD